MSTDNADSANPSVNPEELGFEDAFRRLDEIAERMEAGGLTLTEATARYEQGMKLVQHCNQLLDSAELEITTLRDNYQRSAASQPAQDSDEPPYVEEELYEEVVEDEDELPF